MAKKIMKCGIKECEPTNCFGNAELKIAIHRFFVKCENKTCKLLSKNWKKFTVNDTNFKMHKLHELAWKQLFQYEKWYKIISDIKIKGFIFLG